MANVHWFQYYFQSCLTTTTISMFGVLDIDIVILFHVLVDFVLHSKSIRLLPSSFFFFWISTIAPVIRFSLLGEMINQCSFIGISIHLKRSGRCHSFCWFKKINDIQYDAVPPKSKLHRNRYLIECIELNWFQNTQIWTRTFGHSSIVYQWGDCEGKKTNQKKKRRKKNVRRSGALKN